MTKKYFTTKQCLLYSLEEVQKAIENAVQEQEYFQEQTCQQCLTLRVIAVQVHYSTNSSEQGLDYKQVKTACSVHNQFGLHRVLIAVGRRPAAAW